jgi:hypothetical protein
MKVFGAWRLRQGLLRGIGNKMEHIYIYIYIFSLGPYCSPLEIVPDLIKRRNYNKSGTVKIGPYGRVIDKSMVQTC